MQSPNIYWELFRQAKEGKIKIPEDLSAATKQDFLKHIEDELRPLLALKEAIVGREKETITVSHVKVLLDLVVGMKYQDPDLVGYFTKLSDYTPEELTPAMLEIDRGILTIERIRMDKELGLMLDTVVGECEVAQFLERMNKGEIKLLENQVTSKTSSLVTQIQSAETRAASQHSNQDQPVKAPER